jgi:hypothetical protein
MPWLEKNIGTNIPILVKIIRFGAIAVAVLFIGRRNFHGIHVNGFRDELSVHWTLVLFTMGNFCGK